MQGRELASVFSAIWGSLPTAPCDLGNGIQRSLQFPTGNKYSNQPWSAAVQSRLQQHIIILTYFLPSELELKNSQNKHGYKLTRRECIKLSIAILQKLNTGAKKKNRKKRSRMLSYIKELCINHRPSMEERKQKMQKKFKREKEC